MNQQKNVCPYCGYLISADARFCVRCGNQITYEKKIENTIKDIDVSPTQKNEFKKNKKLLLMFISAFIFIVVIIIATRKNSNSNFQNDNAITNNYETQKVQQDLVMQGHPKLEILEVMKFPGRAKNDSSISKRFLLNEEGDTLEEDDNLIFLRTVNSFDNDYNLIKKAIIQKGEKDIPLYEAKYDNKKIIESSVYPRMDSKITTYYNQEGLPQKSIYSWLDWETIYEYSDDNKLIKESTYNYNNNALLNSYTYNYKNELLVSKVYSDIFPPNDSIFAYQYNKRNRIIEEKVLGMPIVHGELSVVKLTNYVYDGHNDLTEEIKFGKNKLGVIDKNIIMEKINYKYDSKNRLVEKKTDDGVIYKYIYNNLN
ncbi:MAG: zinc ribbon domain-containing protein [Bacteroidetes bacterium]|nr:zinc ribbon domain-containing protein [Bacteroidota bacterium]